jgi:hypothetical protein
VPFEVSSGIEVANSLVLTPALPLVGETASASVLLRNAGPRPVKVHDVGIAVRASTCADWDCASWWEDAAHGGIELLPGGTHALTESRVFAAIGDRYVASPIYEGPGGARYAVPGAQEVAFAVSARGEIRGTVRLQGRADHDGLRVTPWAAGIPGPSSATDAAGLYTLTVAGGTYSVTVESRSHLDGVVRAVNVPPGGAIEAPALMLPGGDATGDECVDIFDLTLVGARFYTTLETPGWDPKADVNGDSRVDILDLSAVGANFTRCGPVVAAP